MVAHALDVAAVAMLLPSAIAPPIPRRTLGFLVSLHDIGKFSRPFQAMDASQWPGDVLGPLGQASLGGRRHDALGHYLLRYGIDDPLDHVLERPGAGRRGWTTSDRAHVFHALAGHHGRPVDSPSSVFPHEICPACQTAASDFARAMLDVFTPAPLPLPPGRDAVARLGWDLAGLLTLADWIGSRQTWFPYTPVTDTAAYFWDLALPRAAAAIARAGLSPALVARFGGAATLFPRITRASPVQAWAETVPLPPGPILAVIEDVTGSGKTEAALILAHRLLASGQAGGVFLALPTMATANAMFRRMADAYSRLFQPGSFPSLVLAHGRAALDPRFGAIIAGGATPGRSPADPADMPAEAHCAAWLAEDRRRALLAQFGVGTIDQALLAVLPVRHAVLRLQGLKGKVLIVDEAHAFDPYVERELVELLRFHAALGGSAILLSATLTIKTRQTLIDAFRSGLGQAPLALDRSDYPLATLAAAGSITEQHCPIRDGLARRVAVTRIEDATAALARIVTAARAGAAVAWVRNTVDDAIAAAELLRAAGVEPLLFHARFALVDRLAVEEAVLRHFGPLSAGKERRTVVVATQVIEQSLDLDFDLLCTDLAPADLLIQRAGRLWRHRRDRSARPLPGPELLVMSPAPIGDPPPNWIKAAQPGTAAVYRDPALLWRSARAVFAAGAISTPDDMRTLIEGAAEGEIPPGLSDQAQRAEGQAQAAAGMARMNTLNFRNGYSPQNGLWEPETHTPTRLEDRPTVTLRLARVQDGAVIPYAPADTPARAWSLSEVSVAAHHVASCPVPPGLEAAAEAARGQWGPWERESPRILLAVLTESGNDHKFIVTTASGDRRRASYRQDRGFTIGTLME